MKTQVFMGFAEALSAPEVAWSLVDAGHEIVVIARKGRHSALRHSSHVSVVEVTAPETNFAATISEIEQLLAARSGPERAAVLLPLDDAALYIWNLLKLPAGCTNAGASGPAANLALDKTLQVKSAADAGFCVPATTIACTTAEVHARRGELPLVLRPANAVWAGQRGLQKGRNWICATTAELERAMSIWAEQWPLLVQPFIKGTGEGVFGLATPNGIQSMSAHRRLRMMNPHGSGSSACVSQPVAGEIQAAAEHFIRNAGWRGLFMIELLRDHSGTHWFVELNGRSWGSMALSRRQGLDYPAWTVALALNPEARFGTRPMENRRLVCRNAGREFMHLLFVLRGPKSTAIQPWPSFWRTAVDLLSVHRGDGIYNWRRDDPKVFFSDWWYTVRDNLYKSRG